MSNHFPHGSSTWKPSMALHVDSTVEGKQDLSPGYSRLQQWFPNCRLQTLGRRLGDITRCFRTSLHCSHPVDWKAKKKKNPKTTLWLPHMRSPIFQTWRELWFKRYKSLNNLPYKHVSHPQTPLLCLDWEFCLRPVLPIHIHHLRLSPGYHLP